MKTYGQLEQQLQSFLEHHLHGLENHERIEALTWYCQGLGLELPNKTSYGIASRLAPKQVQSCRQRMQRAIQRGRFTHDDVFGRVQSTIFRLRANEIQAYCVDDTGFAKKGDKSVGVQRQYSGTLGKIGNCQIAVSLHAASDRFSACLGAQLYLPESWANDDERLIRAGVPEEIGFRTKGQIALTLINRAKANGAPKRPVLADAAYGDSRDFRDAITRLGWHYVVAVSANTTVWPPGAQPQRPPQTGKPGRPFSQDRDPGGAKPIRIDKLAAAQWEQGSFRQVTWRNGSNDPRCGRFLALRVHTAEGRTKRKTAGRAIWLLIEHDDSAREFKYYFSSLPQSTPLKKLVALAKLRWRVERDYQDMKQKLGLDRYEGRTWGGFHRHYAMVALVHAFISLYRENFSPGGEPRPLDLGRLPPCPCCGAHQLDRPLPNVLSAF